MNRNQRYVVLGAIGALVIMFLFPPFHPRSYSRARYDIVFQASGEIDFGLLVVQWILLGAICGLLFFVFRDPPLQIEMESQGMRMIHCLKCGQKLRISASAVPLKVTCRACGYSFACDPLT